MCLHAQVCPLGGALLSLMEGLCFPSGQGRAIRCHPTDCKLMKNLLIGWSIGWLVGWSIPWLMWSWQRWQQPAFYVKNSYHHTHFDGCCNFSKRPKNNTVEPNLEDQSLYFWETSNENLVFSIRGSQRYFTGHPKWMSEKEHWKKRQEFKRI